MRMSTSGWKKTLTMPRPVYDVASMCSMSLTVVVSAALEPRDDAAGHLIGRQAGVTPDDGDHGNADIGENINRHSQGGERSDNKYRQGENDKRIGPHQSDTNNANHGQANPLLETRTLIGPTFRKNSLHAPTPA